MNSQLLKTSFFVEASHGEIYTGGPVAHLPEFGMLVTPQNEIVNSIPIVDTGIYVFPLAAEDDSRVMAVAVHPVLSRLAVAFQSGMIRIYECATINEVDEKFLQWSNTASLSDKNCTMKYCWKEISKWKSEFVTWMDWYSVLKTNPLLAVASADKSVKVYDQIGQYCSHKFSEHSAPVMYCKFDSQETYTLFSSSQDCTVRVWSLKDSKNVAVLKNHTSLVTSIDFIDSDMRDRKLVTVGMDLLISIYKMDKKWTLYNTIPVFESLRACMVLDTRLEYPRDSTCSKDIDSADILVAGESGELKIYNSKSAKLVYSRGEKEGIVSVEYLFKFGASKYLSNPLLVLITSEQKIMSYDLKLMELKSTRVGYNDEILDLEYVGKDKLAVATNSSELHVFKLPSFSSIPFKQSLTHKAAVLAVAVSPCNNFIATASKDQTIIIWHVERQEAIAQFLGHISSVTCVQFSSQKHTYLVTGGKDMNWKLWDLKFLKNLNDLSLPLRVEKSLITVKAHTKDINCLAVSPDNLLLASGSQDKDIKLFSCKKILSQTPICLGTLKGHTRGVWDLMFSPVDKVLASCSADQTLRLWSIKDFTCLKVFQGHMASPLKVKFISSGLQLVSVGSDNLIKVWNIHSCECVNTFDVHTDKIWAISVEPESDGDRFVTGGSDSMICLFKDNTQEIREEQYQKHDKDILEEQNLNNFIKEKNYKEAIFLALSMQKPLLLYSILEEIISIKNDFDSTITSCFEKLNHENLETLMSYIKDWNTHSKHSVIAQKLLYILFSVYQPDSFLKFTNLKQDLQALIPYTMRHYQRIDKLIQESYLIDYTIQRMNSFINDVTEDEV